jgi:hypothetical protein
MPHMQILDCRHVAGNRSLPHIVERARSFPSELRLKAACNRILALMADALRNDDFALEFAKILKDGPKFILKRPAC